jgi:hypothetical protein
MSSGPERDAIATVVAARRECALDRDALSRALATRMDVPQDAIPAR